MKILLILSILLIQIIVSYCGCVQDWECGNSPYTKCKTNKTIVENYGTNIDIERSTGRILFSVKYPDEFEVRIISIPVDGTPDGKNVQSHSVLYGQSTYQLIMGLQQYVGPLSKSMIVNRVVRIAGSTANVFFANNTFGNELTWTSTSNFIFDEVNNIQYSAWPYTSAVYKGPIGDYNNLGVKMYLGTINEIKMSSINSPNIYISSGQNIVKGNVNGPFGGPVSNLPIVFSTANLGSFEIDENLNCWYINTAEKKIYQISLSNPSIPKKLILNQGAVPSTFKYYNGYIYYQMDKKILRVSINGNNSPQVLFDSNSLDGHCICAQGFTGSNCNECDQSNNIISWVNGTPRCIPRNWRSSPPNNPVTCDYDYQCTPYGVSTCSEIVLSGGNKGCTNIY